MAPVVAPSRVRTVEMAAASPTMRNATMLTYIGIALLCLVPGLIGMAGVHVSADTPAGLYYQRLQAALLDIRFGSGLRFWLGVTGATMMGLLLLYPLRKAFARGRRLGSVRGWFHAHILMGLFGPVLILYHANFGHGALNANVALWSMLVIAASGIVGHFVYTRVSAHFYGDKRKARDLLDAVVAGLRTLGGAEAAVLGLVGGLEACEAGMLAPRRGIVASVAARVRTTVYRRLFHRELTAILHTCANEQRWTAAHGQQRAHHLHGLLKSYMDSVQRAAGRSVLEQLWARWRMFHLPVFLIMIAAVVLHVVAVWGMDSDTRDVAATPPPFAATQVAGAQAVGGTAQAAAPAARPKADRVAIAPARSEPTIEDVLARLVDKPAEVRSPPGTKAPAKPLTRPVPTAASSPPPISSVSGAKSREKPASSPPDAIETTYAELQRRLEQPPVASIPVQGPAKTAAATQGQIPPPMGLGAGAGLTGVHRVASLAERIADLKQRNFDHNTTRFPLTGKHAKLDCAACHTAMLENNPRECIACHKKDEPHKGRRPDCAKCHTTNRWTQILRRPAAN